MFKVLFIDLMRQLANNYRTGYYDERNEWASRLAYMAYDRLAEKGLIIAPNILTIIPNDNGRYRFQ